MSSSMSSLIGQARGSTGMRSPMGSTGAGNKIPKGYQEGRLQQFTPEQMQLFEQMIGRLGPDSQLGKLAGGDEEAFNQMEAPAMRQFAGIQGGLASRFSGMGMGGRKSSGFQNTMNQAGSDFAQQLQSRRMELQRQAQQDLHGMSRDLLNQKPYENFITEKEQPWWKQLLSGLGNVGGQFAGGAASSLGNNFANKILPQGECNMVQIIPRNQPSFIESFFGGVNKGMDRGHEFNKIAEEARIKKNQTAKDLAGDEVKNKENYEIMKHAFGEEFANVWKAHQAGGQTALTTAALEQGKRKLPIGGLFGQEDETKKEPSNVGYKLNTEGMTPKDVKDFKMNLRKENYPIWKDTIDRNKSYKELDTDIGILSKLNEKKNLPEKFAKALINPETGAPYDRVSAIKDMHPDVQQWVKTIARQATQAQTSFPGRVTNFDLMSYMRQFPNLFNTYEGRKVILKQMKLSNEAHKLMTESLSKVYNKHKLSGITPEDAEDIAHENVRGRLEEIDKELLDLAGEGEILAEEGSNQKGSKPSQMIDVIGPDGQLYEIDQSEVELLPPGYRIQ